MVDSKPKSKLCQVSLKVTEKSERDSERVYFHSRSHSHSQAQLSTIILLICFPFLYSTTFSRLLHVSSLEVFGKYTTKNYMDVVLLLKDNFIYWFWKIILYLKNIEEIILWILVTILIIFCLCNDFLPWQFEVWTGQEPLAQRPS